MKTLVKNAYVYVWFTPDWVPFYVGMGKTPSRWNPLRIKKKDRNPWAFAIVGKHGAEHIRVHRLQNLSWVEAQELERSLISHFRRAHEGGTLVNFTDGGEGVLSPRPEVTAARRSKLLDPAHPMREYHKVLNSDPEIKKRRVEGIRAAQEKRRKTMSDPEALAQRKARVTATLNSQEYKDKRSQWDTPEYREKLAAARREYWAKKRAEKLMQASTLKLS